ncbi:MAG: hypothetical protein SVO01_08880 [Thermotogota bacterium]|nr:hypothetical protein [Thermotogota bacterium]
MKNEVTLEHGFSHTYLCIKNKVALFLSRLRQLIKLESTPRYSWPDRIYKVDPDEHRKWLEKSDKEWKEQTKKKERDKH